MFRIGFGYDVHHLVKGLPLILGGVEIPEKAGLEGHSDADVLTHAIIDAVIGALGMGDIGQHFPDTDPVNKDISSLLMLGKVMKWVRRDELRLNNLDATIVAEGPRLAPYLSEMRAKIARVVESSETQINIKGTTTEGLGFSGRREGIEAYAVVSLVKSSAS